MIVDNNDNAYYIGKDKKKISLPTNELTRLLKKRKFSSFRKLLYTVPPSLRFPWIKKLKRRAPLMSTMIEIKTNVELKKKKKKKKLLQKELKLKKQFLKDRKRQKKAVKIRKKAEREEMEMQREEEERQAALLPAAPISVNPFEKYKKYLIPAAAAAAGLLLISKKK